MKHSYFIQYEIAIGLGGAWIEHAVITLDEPLEEVNYGEVIKKLLNKSNEKHEDTFEEESVCVMRIDKL